MTTAYTVETNPFVITCLADNVHTGPWALGFLGFMGGYMPAGNLGITVSQPVQLASQLQGNITLPAASWIHIPGLAFSLELLTKAGQSGELVMPLAITLQIAP